MRMIGGRGVFRFGEGVVLVCWVMPELVGAELGDVRLNDRLVKIVEAFAQQPETAIPQACGKAGAKAAYRFFDNQRVRAEDILAAHVGRTARRAAEHAVVLAPQDTTTWSLEHHPATQGLGPVSNSPKAQGLLVHSTLLLSAEGVPLGVLDQQVWARRVEDYGASYKTRRKPLSEKESQRWLQSLAAVEQALPDHPQVVVIGDREADIFELFAAPRRAGVELLVRVAHTQRRVEHPARYLDQALAAAPLQGAIEIEVPRGDDRPSRRAQLEIRWASLEILPPRNHPQRRELSPLRLQFVLAEERHPPPRTAGICWLLATTLAVENLDDALRCLKWYGFRWRNERFHYVLKTGCKIEELQLETAARLERALACYSIVAWRLLWLTYEARAQPEASCACVLQPHEWQSLHATVHRKRPLPAQPPTLRTAVRMIAQLGGFLGRKHDGEPGTKTLWRGYRRLQDISRAWQLAQKPRPPTEHLLDVGNG